MGHDARTTRTHAHARAQEYEFYFICKFLMEKGANPQLKNKEGHAAINGIDGGKDTTDPNGTSGAL